MLKTKKKITTILRKKLSLFGISKDYKFKWCLLRKGSCSATNVCLIQFSPERYYEARETKLNQVLWSLLLYFFERRKRVELGNYYSSWKPISVDAKRDSVLESFLFLIYLGVLQLNSNISWITKISCIVVNSSPMYYEE